VVPCRGCGRGEFRNFDTDQCEHCLTGFYQDLDNHDGNLEKIRSCKVCPAGNYAPKILDYGHFESMPVELFATCSETNDVGNSTNCDIIKSWHVNSEG
jgi:hypothetical protein